MCVGGAKREREQALAEGECTKSTRKGGKERGATERYTEAHTLHFPSVFSWSITLLIRTVPKMELFSKRKWLTKSKGVSLSAYMSFATGRARGRKWKDCSTSLSLYISGWQNDQVLRWDIFYKRARTSKKPTNPRNEIPQGVQEAAVHSEGMDKLNESQKYTLLQAPLGTDS